MGARLRHSHSMVPGGFDVTSSTRKIVVGKTEIDEVVSKWTGVPLTTSHTPKWMFIFPAVLILHGFTSYLGLRTAGNFSMFSNLRTEGARSNHLVLADNPLKLWGYDEDAVRVLRCRRSEWGGNDLTVHRDHCRA